MRFIQSTRLISCYQFTALRRSIGYASGTYRCPRCGRTWYSVDCIAGRCQG